METTTTKEFTFKGLTINGILFIFINLAIHAIGCWLIFSPPVYASHFIIGAILNVIALICWGGFVKLEPGETAVMMFFGKYQGTFSKAGFYWVNPFINIKKLSLRARNLDAEPIKVNDKTGNPVMIGLVLVWKLKDTYKAMFDVDTQTMAVNGKDASTAGMMQALQRFVSIQANAALRQVAGQYAYDNEEGDEITLRDGSEEINKELEQKIDERLAMAGIEVVEARINYLAYAPEIAAVMLRRQQASAIIAAREKIVSGAVSMVKMALDKLNEDKIVNLDDEKKASMVSNLLVVLCGDESAQPVVNTGNS